jgi:hypothetical protein
MRQPRGSLFAVDGAHATAANFALNDPPGYVLCYHRRVRNMIDSSTRRKLTYFSVIFQNRGKEPDSPSRVQKGPDKEFKYFISPTLPGKRDRAMYAQPYPVERSHTRVSNGPKLRNGDAVNEERSKLNVIHKGKLTDLSVALQDQEKIQTYLVSPVKDHQRSRGRT